MTSAGQVAVALGGLGLAGSGLAMLLSGLARLSSVLLLVTGGCLVAGALLLAAGDDDAAALGFVIGGVAGAVALEAYPFLRWRHPVDVAALVLTVVAGAALVIGVAVADPDVESTAALVLCLVLFSHTWWRIETSDDGELRALVWMALSTAVVGLGIGLLVFVAEGSALVEVSLAAVALVGAALYVGVSPEFVDVRGLVVRVVVFCTTVTVMVAVLVLVLVALDQLAPTPNTGVFALVAAVLAAGFAPLQRTLRVVIDELLFGHRPDPLVAATRLAGDLGEDPASALDAIRESLVLPYAELRVDGEVVAASGDPVPFRHTTVVDPTAQLDVGLRPGDLGLPEPDQRVLALAAPLLSQALRARRLADDLAESRGQTIAAREEERRRLRRDLHDGLGPRLSGVAFTSDAARNLLRSDPDSAEALLVSLRRETATAIEDIRQLVYAMRPPALDELGLVGALRQAGEGLRLDVLVRSSGDLTGLPAAVEVAAYRIVAEALTNAARHASGDAAVVTLTASAGGLEVEVQDDGAGGPDGDTAWATGVGLASMRERAAELGGTLRAGATPTGGLVRAHLPC